MPRRSLHPGREAPTSEPEGGSGRSQTEQTPWLPAEALTQLLLLSRPPASLLSHAAGSGPPFSSGLQIRRGPCGSVRLFRKPCVCPTSLSLSSRHLITAGGWYLLISYTYFWPPSLTLFSSGNHLFILYIYESIFVFVLFACF